MSFTTLLKLILEALPLVPDVEKFIEDLYAVVTKHTTAASQTQKSTPPAVNDGVTAAMLAAATAGMLCLELLLVPQPAYAADINKAKVVAAAPAAASNFYIGAWGGLGLSNTVNQFTLNGTAGGSLSPFATGGYPTGLIAGLEFGYLNAAGPIVYGAYVDVGYDFQDGCIGAGCVAQRKQSWVFTEAAEVGISPTTLFGFVPSTVQPSNWPVPINVPAALSSNLLLLADGGYAERKVGLCGVVDVTNDVACGNQFIAAPFAGLDLKFMAAGTWDISAKWAHIFWGNQYSFTTGFSAGGIPVFANPTQIKSEDRFTLGVNYHLPTGTFFGL